MDIDLEYNLKFSHCLYNYVSVTTLPNKQVYEGWLKTIDPVSGNLFLITLTDDSSEVDKIVLIMRDTYEDVKVLKEEDPNIKSMLQNLYSGKSHLEIDEVDRKELLVAWIKRHRLPLREIKDGKALVVSESVTIHPPYNAESCSGSNGRVLMLIRNLVDKLPVSTLQPTTANADTAEKNA